MPARDRLLQGARLRGGLDERRAETPGPRHAFLAPESAEQLVPLGVAFPLILEVVALERVLVRVVALADDDVESAAAQVVEGGVVLCDADRVGQ